MTLRLGETGVRAGISKGSNNISVIVFRKIKQSTVLSHHFHSIAAIQYKKTPHHRQGI